MASKALSLVRQKLRQRRTPAFPDPHKLLRFFSQAGPGPQIFEILPFLGQTSVFPTKSGGYGVLMEVAGLETDGIERYALDAVSQAMEATIRSLPEDLSCYFYVDSREKAPLDAPLHPEELVAFQQLERKEFLEQIAKFKEIRLYLCLYSKGRRSYQLQAEQRRKAKARQLSDLQRAVLLVLETVQSACGIRLCTQSETTEWFSYLQNLEEHLTWKTPVNDRAPEAKQKEFAACLGNSHIKFDRETDSLRIGKRWAQMFAMKKRPEGTRPNLWGELYQIPCDFILCFLWRPETGARLRRALRQQEESENLATVNIGATVMELFIAEKNLSPVPTAAAIASQENVKKLGKTLARLQVGQHTFGHFSVFGLVHSRQREEVVQAMPKFAKTFMIPAHGMILEENDAAGSLSAYLSLFPGNQAFDIRHRLLRSDHAANLMFPYRPYLGQPWSKDLHAPYTYLLQTPTGVPYYYCPFEEGDGCWIVIGAKGTGKSLLLNTLLAAERKHNGFLLIIDTGDSYSHNIESLGGAAARLTPQGPGINFFAQPSTPAVRDAIVMALSIMIRTGGIKLQPGDTTLLAEAVATVYRLPESLRCLGACARFIDEQRLQQGLEKWIHGREHSGPYAAVFDNVQDRFSLARFQSIDLAAVKGAEYRDLLEVYLYWTFFLFRQIIEDPAHLGVPKTLIGEEFWSLIKSKRTMSEMARVAKGDRKYLARFVVVCHSIRDMGRHAETLRTACPHLMFTGGPFLRQRYREHFGLNNTQMDMIRALKKREILLIIGPPGNYTKKVIHHVDPRAYLRVTTKPSEMLLRRQYIEQYGRVKGMLLLEKHFAQLEGEERKALTAGAEGESIGGRSR